MLKQWIKLLHHLFLLSIRLCVLAKSRRHWESNHRPLKSYRFVVVELGPKFRVNFKIVSSFEALFSLEASFQIMDDEESWLYGDAAQAGDQPKTASDEGATSQEQPEVIKI